MTYEPTLTVMCGLPGSGKSTWAAKTGKRVLSADGIKTGADPRETFTRMFALARSILSSGQDVVIDICALRPEDRRPWLNLAKQMGARTHLVVLDTPYSTCRARDAQRPPTKRARVEWHTLFLRWSSVHSDLRRERWGRVSLLKGEAL